MNATIFAEGFARLSAEITMVKHEREMERIACEMKAKIAERPDLISYSMYYNVPQRRLPNRVECEFNNLVNECIERIFKEYLDEFDITAIITPNLSAPNAFIRFITVEIKAVRKAEVA